MGWFVNVDADNWWTAKNKGVAFKVKEAVKRDFFWH